MATGLTGIAGSNPAEGMDVCVVFVSKDKKEKKARTIKTKKQAWIKYKERSTELKKSPAGGMDVCVVRCRGISDMRTEDMKVHWMKKTTKEKSC